jgi:hypothetical protein
MRGKICFSKKIGLSLIVIVTPLLFAFVQNLFSARHESLNSRASATTPNETNIIKKTITVCPTDTIDSSCTFIGPNGIREAIDSIATTEKVVILVKKGTYTYTDLLPHEGQRSYDCAIVIKNKNIEIKGEGDGLSKINLDSYRGGFPPLLCIDGGSVEISHLSLSGTKDQRGIMPLHAAKAIISGNFIQGFDAGIFIDGENTEVEIRSNIITDSSGAGISNDRNDSINQKFTIYSNILEKNTTSVFVSKFSSLYFYKNVIKNSGIGLRIDVDPESLVFVFNNFFELNKKMGINIDQSSSQFIIQNNLFYKNGDSIYTSLMIDLIGIKILDNMFIKSTIFPSQDLGGNGFALHFSRGGYADIRMDRNVFWMNESGIYNKDQSHMILESESINEDPQFVSEENEDFHLKSTSPARLQNGEQIGLFGNPVSMKGISSRDTIEPGFFGGACYNGKLCKSPFNCTDIKGSGTFQSGTCK